jgi:hypothetical protein
MRQFLSLGAMLLLITIVVISCDKNDDQKPPPVPEIKDTVKLPPVTDTSVIPPPLVNPPVISSLIGKNFEGGVIFYVDSTGQHGLIVTSTDLSTGIKWCNNCDVDSVRTTASGYAIGTGAANTVKIVTQFKQGEYAAKLCSDLVLNGYDDWFLPSGGELQEIFNRRDKLGAFTEGWYWSSTDLGGDPKAYYARNIHFPEGTVKLNGNMLKGSTNRVRAIRAF